MTFCLCVLVNLNVLGSAREYKWQFGEEDHSLGIMMHLSYIMTSSAFCGQMSPILWCYRCCCFCAISERSMTCGWTYRQ